MTAHEEHDSHDEELTRSGKDPTRSGEDLTLSGSDAAAFLAMLRLQDDAESPAGSNARAFDIRLASDATSQSDAQSLAQIDAMLRAAAARSTATDVSRATSDRALQASLRLMREQALIRRQTGAGRSHRRLAGVPRWAWASGLAAALAIGFVFWTVNTEPGVEISTKMSTSVAEPYQPFTGPIAGNTSDPSGFYNADDINVQLDALSYITQMDEAN